MQIHRRKDKKFCRWAYTCPTHRPPSQWWLYLISRFFLMTAQTRVFPTMHKMMSMDVTTVTATPVASDITKHNNKKKSWVDLALKADAVHPFDSTVSSWFEHNLQWKQYNRHLFCASKGFVMHQRLVELVLCVRSLLEQFENQISETKEEWHSISIKSC